MNGILPKDSGTLERPVSHWVDRLGYRGTGFPTSFDDLQFSQIVAFLLVGFTVWGYVDVVKRGRIVPGRVELHRTDFTVFTEAGAAFFDGRNPYRVTNPRGWFYLYPPFFALCVSPLSSFDTATQVGVWFAASIIAAFGCYVEARRLGRLLVSAETSRDLARWIGACAGLAVLFPTLECLQRGQVGLLLLYPMTLGFRLIAPRVCERFWRLRMQAGSRIDTSARLGRFRGRILEIQNSKTRSPTRGTDMARPPAKGLTERELEVMHVFWSQGEATAAEARDRLEATGLDRTHTTIANLVRGLHEKGFLRQVNSERPFVYQAARTYEDVSGRLLGDLVHRVFRGSRAQLLFRLVDQRKLTAEERAVLEQILNEGDR